MRVIVHSYGYIQWCWWFQHFFQDVDDDEESEGEEESEEEKKPAKKSAAKTKPSELVKKEQKSMGRMTFDISCFRLSGFPSVLAKINADYGV